MELPDCTIEDMHTALANSEELSNVRFTSKPDPKYKDIRERTFESLADRLGVDSFEVWGLAKEELESRFSKRLKHKYTRDQYIEAYLPRIDTATFVDAHIESRCIEKVETADGSCYFPSLFFMEMLTARALQIVRTKIPDYQIKSFKWFDWYKTAPEVAEILLKEAEVQAQPDLNSKLKQKEPHTFSSGSFFLMCTNRRAVWII